LKAPAVTSCTSSTRARISVAVGWASASRSPLSFQFLKVSPASKMRMSTLISTCAAHGASGSKSMVPSTLLNFVVVSCAADFAVPSTSPRWILKRIGGLGRDAVEDERRDVVGAAGAVGGVDQLGDHALERLGAGDDLQDLRIVDHARQPVGA